MDILLVEDSATLRANMESVLNHMGHRVHHAESGEKCLHLFENSQQIPPFDLVLMDVDLPGLDGFETTRLLREILHNQWIPIIFVTAVTDEASYAKGIEAGGDDYLAKPVSAVILKAKIRAMGRIAEMQHRMARLNKALRSTSERDTLTHLLNRRAFTRRAERRWQHYKRRGATSAVIMLDVDWFKQYNDTYGHMDGDVCLRRVASAIRGALGDKNHLVARYGGEEFIVFLSDTTAEQASAVAEDIRLAIYGLDIEHNTAPARRITISGGVSITRNPANHTLNKLITAADKQLYRVKNSGRNRTSLAELDNHKTVLICVREAADLAYLSQFLTNRGNIVTAENGAECIEIASYILPDMVVVGSGVSGTRDTCAYHELKQYEATASIPVVVLRENIAQSRCCAEDDNCVIPHYELASIAPVLERYLH